MYRIGADVVGMSTVPEVLVAKHRSLPVFVVSVVSNQGYPPESIQETTVEAVIAMVSSVEPKLRAIVRQLLLELSS
jgi:purine-nucleoside phosphorylase